MMKLIKYIVLPVAAALMLCSCNEEYVTYSDAEYVMFADTLATYPVQKDVDYFSIPVVSTVTRDYDRTFGVEIVDKGSNAVETVHYTLESNTITIPAGKNSTEVRVRGCYDNIEADDSLGFTLSLVMNDKLEMPLYGRETKAVLMKVCPFEIENFTGWCMLTSMFLYNYSTTGSYQRLIKTEKYEAKENTIICRNWLQDGYDVLMTFHPENPLEQLVTMPDDQIASDEGSFFGTVHGDNRILVKSSSYYDSCFYTCGNYLYVWAEIYVNKLDGAVGTVGHFYNTMEWVSEEEANRLRREEGM